MILLRCFFEHKKSLNILLIGDFLIILRIWMLQCDQSRRVHHYPYKAWPDHGVPPTSQRLVWFVPFVRLSLDDKSTTDGPTVVQCTAGWQ